MMVDGSIRWRIRVEDKLGGEVHADLTNTEFWRTGALLAEAKKAGYDDWCVPPEDFVPSWEWADIDDETKKRLIPKYPLPDSVV